MRTKERIAAIRLMEKLEQRPGFAAKVGISFGTKPLSGKINDRKEDRLETNQKHKMEVR